MRIAGVGVFLYVMGMLSIIIEAVVVLITSLQTGKFVWSDDNWLWFGISVTAVVIGFGIAIIGATSDASRMMRD